MRFRDVAQVQHTSSHLLIGIESHNCSLLLAGYTDQREDDLLPRCFSWVTRILGGRWNRALFARTLSLSTYSVRLADVLMLAVFEMSLLQFGRSVRLRRIEREWQTECISGFLFGRRCASTCLFVLVISDVAKCMESSSPATDMTGEMDRLEKSRSAPQISFPGVRHLAHRPASQRWLAVEQHSALMSHPSPLCCISQAKEWGKAHVIAPSYFVKDPRST